MPKLGSPLGTLVAACLLVVSGCGNAVEGSVPTNGPLNGGTDITLTCLEDKGATDFTFGAGFVRNTGTQPVKILGVRLIRPKNFELLETFALPLGDNLVGSWSQWPPPAEFVPRSTNWQDSDRADQKTLGPVAGSNSGSNLVAQLRRAQQAEPARTDGLRVTYSVDGKTFVADTTVGLAVRRTGTDKC